MSPGNQPQRATQGGEWVVVVMVAAVAVAAVVVVVVVVVVRSKRMDAGSRA